LSRIGPRGPRTGVAAPRLIGQRRHFPAGLPGDHLDAGVTLGDEALVEGLVHGRADGRDAVMGHDHDRPVAQQIGDAVALLVVRDRLIAGAVVDDPVVEQQVVVVHELEFAVGEQRQRRQIGRMDMHDAGRAGLAQMDARMDVERDLAQFPRAAHDIAVEIADDQRTGGDLLEQHAARIDQEQRALAIARQHHGIVVADLLVPVEPRADAEYRRHVAAQLPLREFVVRAAARAQDGGHAGLLPSKPAAMRPGCGPHCRTTTRALSIRPPHAEIPAPRPGRERRCSTPPMRSTTSRSRSTSWCRCATACASRPISTVRPSRTAARARAASRSC
jgi:hypothetical protein